MQQQQRRLWLSWILANAVAGILVAIIAILTQFGQLFVTGLIYGAVQWFILRKHLEHIGNWVLASAVGWIIAMYGTVYLGMGYGFSSNLSWMGIAIAQMCILAGQLQKRHGYYLSLWLILSLIGAIAERVISFFLYGVFSIIGGQSAFLLIYLFTGAVYGTITGIALVMMYPSLKLIPKEEQRPMSNRIVSIAAAIIILAFIAVFLNRDFCTKEEKAVFNEFPHYGGIQLTPRASGETGALCGASYTTLDNIQQVMEYYKEQLTAHGWEIQDTIPLYTGEDGVGNKVTSGSISAVRNSNFYYTISFDQGGLIDAQKSKGDQLVFTNDTYVVIHVWQYSGGDVYDYSAEEKGKNVSGEEIVEVVLLPETEGSRK
ncbi:hypothetical protein HYS48_04945 [Candidatus Woesearchaeota archaeon]|nr:hypothetical protein [Candidatus Woesearchaeota archaeon]